ncbi:MAG TPA: competence/damage-inducible protein A [Bacteroidota bacterium]|nr:competence/damage-inducible protein A [Bacteroidota bacterium]
MNAEIITIGDELLIGQVINTNQAYIAGRLGTIGVPVHRMTTVGDGLESILDSFREAWKRSGVVIVTGGLGPTHDDVTKKAVCTFFDSDLVSDADLRKHIEGIMKRRNIGWTPATEEQTMVPRKAQIIPNPVGTAAGMLFQEDEKYFIVLPGVPYEMKEMTDQSVIPFLAPKVKGSVIRHLTLRTTGIPESLLARQLGNLDEILRGAKLAFLPSLTGVRLRITVQERTEATANAIIRQVEERIRAKAQKYIYGTGEEELEESLGKILTERKLTIAVAESCTGGLIANRITNVSGSSSYFDRGVVAYSNHSKTQLLSVPSALIETHGAVSKEVASAMAEGVRKAAHTDIGLSTTGIAGPSGGTPEKPEGLVWIGYSDTNTTIALKFNFGDNRLRFKERASQAALELVRRRVLRIE